MQKMILKYCSVLFTAFLYSAVYSQTGSKSSNSLIHKNWIIQNPFEQKVFIENNEGQFDGMIASNKEKIIYSAEITGVSLYFTSNGLIYRYDKFPKIKPEQQEEQEHKSGRENDTSVLHPKTFFFRMKWKGTNPRVEIIAEDEVSFYYCYPHGNKHTIIAHAFKKLLYKNLYPGIDIEYYFPENKTGLEYSIIVNPGADLSQVKLLFPDAKGKNIDERGNLILQGEIGQFTDHAPDKTFYKESQVEIKSNFVLSNNEVNFNVSQYNHTETLIIDPWITNPAFSWQDKAYQVRYDLNGNVYIYGGDGTLMKINSTGGLVWVFNVKFPGTGGGFGDFVVDEVNGTSYLGEAIGDINGPWVFKVNTLGNLIDSTSVGTNTTMDEIWRMEYNRCLNNIVIGGGTPIGNPLGTDQAGLLDTAFTKFTTVNILGTKIHYHDITLLSIDNVNNFCYMSTAKDILDSTHFNNELFKLPTLNLIPNIFAVLNGYSFLEMASVNYSPSVKFNGYEGIANSPTWLYLYDGSTLKRFDKNNGSISATKKLNTPRYTIYEGISIGWGGIDVDYCDDIYLGNKDSIDEYDSALNRIFAFPIGADTDTVYSLHLAPGNLLYACGNGFVASYNINSPPPISLLISRTPACSGCNGTAIAMVKGCGNKNSTYSYQWSNGQTTQFASGLCAGNYTVTVSSNCEVLLTDTVNIVASINPGINATVNQVNENCYGQSIGSASASASGGSGKYLYFWSPPDDSISSITGLSAGTYTVIVTDTDGCGYIKTVNISQPLPLFTTISTVADSCYGENIASATVNVSGGTIPFTYLWNPGGNTNIKDSALNPGSYTVNVIDSNGCTINDTITIFPAPPPIDLSIDSLLNISCYGINDGYARVSVSGGSPGYYYSWNPPEGSSNQVKNLISGTYTFIVVDNNKCTASINVTITQPSQLYINSLSPIKIYSGQDTVLSASASGGTLPYTYTWNGIGSGSNIRVSPLSTTTYTVQVTDSNGCTATALITVTIENCGEPFIPGAFSPNGDGQNDILYVRSPCIKRMDFIIYDRWGNEIFESQNVSDGWNGTYKGQPMNTGTYVYYLKATMLDGTTVERKGNVTLVR